MKFLFSIAVIVSLTACQTVTELRSASSKGVANSYSCEQITAAFSAYEADKASFDALKQVAVMSGLKLEQKPDGDASSYYDQAKSAATVALLVQGCPPMQ